MLTRLAFALVLIGASFVAACSPSGDAEHAVPSGAEATPEFVAEQAAYEAVGPAAHQNCLEPLRQETGVVLQPATAADRITFGLERSPACLWKVGDIRFDEGRTVGVFLKASTSPEDGTGSALVFSREGPVFMGSLPLPSAFVKVENRNVVLEARRGGVAELERIPVAPDGPPPELTLFSGDVEYVPNDRDRSDVAYARAFREPLGSRRLQPCSVGTRHRLAEPRIRNLLAQQASFPPSSLDGMHCIWKVGLMTGEDGRRYGVYVHGWEGGASKNHAQEKLILLEGDRRFLGTYDLGPGTDVTIRGATILLQSAEPSEPIRIGREGPPKSARIDGQIVTFDRS